MQSNKTIPLNEFITLQRGFDLPSKDRIQGIVPVIASANTVGFHNEAKAKAPGVIIGRSGSIGGGQYIQEDYWPLNTTLWVKDFKEHNPRYIYYVLKNIDFSRFNVGSGVPTLNRNHLSSIRIEDIGIVKERKIAHILSTLDDKIECNRKMNETLEAMAQALFKSWFVDFDPAHARATCKSEADLEAAATKLGISKEVLELFPSEFVESEMGMIPLGWEIVNFKNLVAKYIDNRGKTPPLEESGIPLLEVRTLPQEMLTSDYATDKYVSEETYNTWFRSHLDTDDVLISTVGTIGLTSIVPPNSHFTIAQNVLGIRANEELVDKKYMFYMMKSKSFIHAIVARLVTTVQSSIKRKDMETIEVVIPSLEVQKKFAEVITPMMKKMQSNEIQSLQKLRDSLLPKLLSGELDISQIELNNE